MERWILLFLTSLCLVATGVRSYSWVHHVTERSTYPGNFMSRGCLDLRSKRYISDGFCTTVRPVTEAVCVAKCVQHEPLLGAGVPRQVELRCKEEATRRKVVRFLCRDGTRRAYQIRLVTKCACDKVPLEHSESKKHAARKNAGKLARKMKRIE